MLYISQYNRAKKLYGVTDTDDGATEFLTAAQVLDAVKELKGSGMTIDGVNGNKISVVSLTNQVMGSGFAKIEQEIDDMIAFWSIDTCMDVGRSAHFVSKLKGKSDDEVRRITKEYVYPESIRSAVQNAAQFTNTFREVNVSDLSEVMQALSSNVCLVLQRKSTGVFTSFVCSASLALLDKIYEPYFFDALYLTKQLYSYTIDGCKIRPRTNRPSARQNDTLNVFSCSLRFRNDGVRHNKGNLVLSSPFYSVNLSRLFCMYVLDNPVSMGSSMLTEFHRGQHTGVYDFDFDMWQEVMQDAQSGQNSFDTENEFTRYLDVSSLQPGVTLEDVMGRYARDFNYMRKLRAAGISFVKAE